MPTRLIGYNVLEDEDAALRLLEQAQPLGLLFADGVMLGGLSGADLAREARKRRRGLESLFTSDFAKASLKDDRRADESGRLLSKPYRQEVVRRLGMDEGTLQRYEMGIWEPSGDKTRRLITSFLKEG